MTKTLLSSPSLRNYHGPTKFTELIRGATNYQEINSRQDENQKYTCYLAPGISHLSNELQIFQLHKNIQWDMQDHLPHFIISSLHFDTRNTLGVRAKRAFIASQLFTIFYIIFLACCPAM